MRVAAIRLLGVSILFGTMAVFGGAWAGSADAQEGAVLITEGVGPRAAASLRRELAARWNRPVVALHEAAASAASHMVSVSVHAGRVTVQYRHGSTVRTERTRAGTRRALLLDAVMAAVGATPSATPPAGNQSARVGGALLALEGGEPDTLPVELSDRTAPPVRSVDESHATIVRLDNGTLIGVIGEEASPSRSPDADHVVREIEATSLALDGIEGGSVLLAIE